MQTVWKMLPHLITLHTSRIIPAIIMRKVGRQTVAEAQRIRKGKINGSIRIKMPPSDENDKQTLWPDLQSHCTAATNRWVLTHYTFFLLIHILNCINLQNVWLWNRKRYIIFIKNTFCLHAQRISRVFFNSAACSTFADTQQPLTLHYDTYLGSFCGVCWNLEHMNTRWCEILWQKCEHDDGRVQVHKLCVLRREYTCRLVRFCHLFALSNQLSDLKKNLWSYGVFSRSFSICKIVAFDYLTLVY